MPEPGRMVDIRLYGILDGDRLAGEDLPALARAAASGGVTLLQYRDKHAPTRAMIERARAIRAALAGRVPLLVNDRVDVALAAGVEGVHLGREDMLPMDARRMLGPAAIIGVTLKTEADLAALDPVLVDYGCIGGVFDTTSKDNPDPPLGLAGLASLRRAARASGLPVGAIAGITLENTPACLAAGADGVALISDLFLASDVTARARAYRAAIDTALAGRGAA